MFQHEFRRTGQTTRILADGSTAWSPRVLSDYQDTHEFAGGPSGCSGTISRAEYDARPALYAVGSTWLVKDTVSNEYVFGGELRAPEVGPKTVMLVADGWAKIADSSADTFLVLSYDLSQWIAGDSDPLNYPGTDRLSVEVGHRVVFRVKKHTVFQRNQLGNPAKWTSSVMRWVPGVNLKYLAGDITRSHNDAAYSLEIVGAIGPTGALTVIATIPMTAGSNSFSQIIPDGFDLVGLRLARTSTSRQAPKRKFTVKNLRLGAIATSDSFTLNQMFVALFTRLGATTTGVSASTVQAQPFETDMGTYAQIADEESLLDNWFWRIYPDSTGAKAGQAGPSGLKTWTLERPASPVKLVPAQQYSHVRIPYISGGGITRTKLVAATVNPFPAGVQRVFEIFWDQPPHESIATLFAQKVADYLASTAREGGEFTCTWLRDQSDGVEKHATSAKPGDKLVLANYGNREVIIDGKQHGPDGSVTTFMVSSGQPMLDKWLERRLRLLNRGRSADGATAGLLDLDEPAAPATVVVGFVNSVTKDGKPDYDMIVDVTHLGETINGDGTFIKRVFVKYRPVDAANVPITNAAGGGWHDAVKRAAIDGEDESLEQTKRLIIKKINHPHLWKWEVKAAVFDVENHRSAFTNASPNFLKPAAFGPPDPTGVTMDVDQHAVTIKYTWPGDPGDAHFPDGRIAYAQIQFDDAANFHNWDTNPNSVVLRQDLRHKSSEKRWRFHQPLDGTTYFGRVRFVDSWGNVSNWVSVPGTTKLPPTPGIAFVLADTHGTRHNRLRVSALINPSVPGDDKIQKYVLEAVFNTSAGDPPATDIQDRVSIPGSATGFKLYGRFRGIRPNQFCHFRALAVDAQGRESLPSAWSNAGLAKNLIGANDTPPAVNVVEYIVRKRRVGVRVSTPMDGGVPDERISDIEFQVSKSSSFAVLVDEDTRPAGKVTYRYAIPKADAGVLHFIRFRPLGANDQQGAWQPSISGQALTEEDDAEASADITGTIKAWSGGTAPPVGYLRCNGSLQSTTIFSTLFGLVGHKYFHPAYQTNPPAGQFYVPDFRRRFPKGTGDSQTDADDEGFSEASRDDDNHGDHTGLTDSDDGTHQHGPGSLQFPATTSGTTNANTAANTALQGTATRVTGWGVGSPGSPGHEHNVSATGITGTVSTNLSSHKHAAGSGSSGIVGFGQVFGSGRGHTRHPFIRVHFIIKT